MLIEYGNTTVSPDWELIERVPTGYSRVYYVLSGDVTYESGNEIKHLKPGYIYVLPSTVPYHVWRSQRCDFSCTYLHVVFDLSHVCGLIELDPAEDTCLFHYIAAIRKAIVEKRIELLERMADCFSEFLRKNPLFEPASAMLSTVRGFIWAHITENITVSQLSQLLSYHPNYFIHLFREETGYTPHQYIVQQRMQHAVAQLNRGLDNDELCDICGYADSSTFTRAFRQYYGVTPQKYRQGYRHP